MGRHELCGPHEIFVGNNRRDGTTLDFLISKGMRTVRMGKLAYDIDGKRLPDPYAPIFIGRAESEKYDSIMMERTLGPHWRRS